MQTAAQGPAYVHAALVLVGGTILFLLLLSRAEMLEVWVEIARNTRMQPTGRRYPGIAFLSFVFRLSGSLLLAGSVLAAACIALGIIRTPAIDLRGLLLPDAPPAQAASAPPASETEPTVIVRVPAEVPAAPSSGGK